MSAPDENGWMPWKSAPRDGRIFLATNEAGATFPVYIIVEPPTASVKRGWFGRQIIWEDEGGTYLRGAIPARDGYTGGLVLRPDNGWSPTHWMPLPEPPSAAIRGERP